MLQEPSAPHTNQHQGHEHHGHRGISGKLGDCLKIWGFAFLPPNRPRERSSSGGSSSSWGVCRSQPCHGDKKTPGFLANSLWPALVCALLVPNPPTQLSLHPPVTPAQSPASLITLPVPRLTGELRAGLQPHGQAEEDQGCCWPHWPGHSTTAAGSAASHQAASAGPVLGGSWRRGWQCAGTMARFSALPKHWGWAGACVPALCLLPRARGCSGQLGHSQYRDTSHGEGGTCFQRRSMAGERVLCLGIAVAGRETGSPFPPTSIPPKQSDGAWRGFQRAPCFLTNTVRQKSGYTCAVIFISANVRPFTI